MKFRGENFKSHINSDSLVVTFTFQCKLADIPVSFKVKVSVVISFHVKEDN